MTFTLRPRGDGDLKKRYRPQRLDEVAPTIDIQKLQRIIDDPKSQVYLFEGPSGSGKTSTARILARASICAAQSGKPCLVCDQCKGMESSGDFVEINIADFRKIDDMREFIDGMRFAPMTMNRRIYIMDEIHQLTLDSQQILLKTFEEPNPNLLIIMCTTETKGLKRALIDRAERVVFKSLDEQTARNVIDQVVKETGRNIDRDTGSKLFDNCDGSVRALLNNVQAYLDGTFEAVDNSSDEGGEDAKNLAKALLNTDWKTTSALLKKPDVRNKPESIRITVENYLRAVALGDAVNGKSIGVLGCIVGTVSVEPGISQYNRFVYKCAKACQVK